MQKSHLLFKIPFLAELGQSRTQLIKTRKIGKKIEVSIYSWTLQYQVTNEHFNFSLKLHHMNCAHCLYNINESVAGSISILSVYYCDMDGMAKWLTIVEMLWCMYLWSVVMSSVFLWLLQSNLYLFCCEGQK
jgi:hypothetical protein